MNIELENNSAPRLEKFFKERPDIRGVMLDVDNTLVLTDKYFRDAAYCIGMDIAELTDISKPSWVISEEIDELRRKIYKDNDYHPILMDELSEEALKQYLKVQEISPEMKGIINYWLRDFYLRSPELNDRTIDVLRDIRRCDIRIGLHSHAQDGWTEVKAKYLSEKFGEYIPHFSTGLDMKKDKDRWIKSCEIIDTPIENTLVIGDSFSSDIISSIQAGCKHVIWIDRYNEGLSEEYIIPEGVEVIVVNDIGKVLEL